MSLNCLCNCLSASFHFVLYIQPEQPRFQEDPTRELCQWHEQQGHRKPLGKSFAFGESASHDISPPSPVLLPPRASVPVLASLLFEKLIKLQHLAACDHEGLQPRQHLAQELQVVVHSALAITPHIAAGAPEDEHGALADVEQVVAVAEDPLDAGMCDDPQAGAIAHVAPIAPRRGVIHADDALGLVNLGASPAAQEMPRAGHQGTVPAVHFQRLKGRRRRTPSAGNPRLAPASHFLSSEDCPSPISSLPCKNIFCLLLLHQHSLPSW